MSPQILLRNQSGRFCPVSLLPLRQTVKFNQLFIATLVAVINRSSIGGDYVADMTTLLFVRFEVRDQEDRSRYRRGANDKLVMRETSLL